MESRPQPLEASQSPEVLAAYEAKAARSFLDDDPRERYTYMGSKMRCDYTLLERVEPAGRRILNVGCSFPIDEIYYARKVGSWVSVDISETSLAVARAIVQRELHPDLAAKFEFRYGDACQLPFDDASFDIAVSMSTFDHLPSAGARQKAIDEMARVVRPGGHVIVTVANRWNLPYRAGIRKMTREKTLHYGYAYLFSPRELRDMLRKAGVEPGSFASSIAAPEVWLPGYPIYVRWPARAAFGILRALSYCGRRVGYAAKKP
jgi:ubiquinone/menaquinone biosynthesis C-methylase UbiE